MLFHFILQNYLQSINQQFSRTYPRHCWCFIPNKLLNIFVFYLPLFYMPKTCRKNNCLGSKCGDVHLLICGPVATTPMEQSLQTRSLVFWRWGTWFEKGELPQTTCLMFFSLSWNDCCEMSHWYQDEYVVSMCLNPFWQFYLRISPTKAQRRNVAGWHSFMHLKDTVQVQQKNISNWIGIPWKQKWWRAFCGWCFHLWKTEKPFLNNQVTVWSLVQMNHIAKHVFSKHQPHI